MYGLKTSHEIEESVRKKCATTGEKKECGGGSQLVGEKDGELSTCVLNQKAPYADLSLHVSTLPDNLQNVIESKYRHNKCTRGSGLYTRQYVLFGSIEKSYISVLEQFRTITD